MPGGQQIDIGSHFICKSAGCQKDLLYGTLVLGDLLLIYGQRQLKGHGEVVLHLERPLCQESADR